MYPEDPVIIGVMNRRKDFEIAQQALWYRVPVEKAPKAGYMRYVGFFFSRDFGNMNGTIHYFAEITGHERATRAQLLPEETGGKKDDTREYFKLQFRELRAKVPPIINQHKRRLAFIFTTWDRFIHAQTISDLYSREDHLVDRVYYALKEIGFQPVRDWQWEIGYPAPSPQVRLLCEQGEVIATTRPAEGLAIHDDLAETIARIQAEIQAKGGPKFLPIPLD